MLIHKEHLDAAITALRAELIGRFEAPLNKALTEHEELSARLALIEQAIGSQPPGPHTRLQINRLVQDAAKKQANG